MGDTVLAPQIAERVVAGLGGIGLRAREARVVAVQPARKTRPREMQLIRDRDGDGDGENPDGSWSALSACPGECRDDGMPASSRVVCPAPRRPRQRSSRSSGNDSARGAAGIDAR
jgi:hypothetical protein